MPQKQSKTPHRKEVKTAQISPNMTKKANFNIKAEPGVFLGGDDFYGASDKNNDNKMVNISIDELVNDEEDGSTANNNNMHAD